MRHMPKKSSFSYLSMCSCCNIVSKYSVNVKKHLQQQHSGDKWSKGKKLVIPVRISSRYEKCIHRSLDKNVKRQIKDKETIRSTPDVKEHAKKKHVDNSMGGIQPDTGRSGRKRKPPKWLEDSNFNLKMSKKVKLDNQRKELGRQSLSSEISTKTETSKTINKPNKPRMAMQEVFESKEDSKSNLKTMLRTPNMGRKAKNQGNSPKVDKNAFEKIYETSLPSSDNKQAHKSKTDSLCTPVKVALIRLPSEEQHMKVLVSEGNGKDELTVVNKSKSDKIGKDIESFENKTEEKSMVSTSISQILEENKSSMKIGKENALLIKKMNVDFGKGNQDDDAEFFVDDADLHDSDDDYNPDEEDTDHDLDNEMELPVKKKNKKTYACHKCDKSYELLNSLNRHLQKVHTDQEKDGDLVKQNKNKKEETKLVKSPQPLKNVNSVKLEDDQILVTKYKCPFCHFYLYHREYIISHVQHSHAEAKNFTTHDIVIEKVVIEKDFDREFFKCHKCSHEEKWKKDMLNHMTYCIKRKFRSLGLPCLLPESYTMKRLQTADLVCPVCQDVKTGKDELEKHMKEEHIQEKQCHVQLRSSLPEPQPMPKKCTDHFCFICPSCHFSTRRKDMLRDHLRSHKNHNLDVKLPLIKCILLSEDTSEASEHNKSSDFSVINRSKQDHISEAMTKATASDREMRIKYKTGDQQGTDNQVKTIGRNEIKSDSTLGETKLIEGTYICPLCENFSTMSKENSVQHMLNYHPDKTIEYDIHYILPDIVLKEDKSNRTRGKMVCTTCGLSDLYLWNLVKHINLTRGHKGYTGKSKIKGLRPPFVRSENSTSTSVSPEKEEKPCRQLFDILVTPGTGLEYINEREGVAGQYSCEECEDVCTYSTKKSLLKHLKQRHDDKCLHDTYACVFQMRDVIAGGADKTYLCNVCQEKVRSKGKLVEHFRTKHHGKLSELIEMIKNPNSQLECEVCHKELDTKENLNRHLLMHVNQWQPHCPCCVLSFDTQQDADHHAAVYHADECKICYVCAKTFINDRSYQTHMKQHENTGNGNDAPETPDSSKCLCQHCGTSVGISSYKRHVLRFHWQHVACECEICVTQKVPSNKSSLKCDVCSRIVCSRYALDAHCWKHHPERYKRSFKTCQTCKRPMHGFDTEILCACKPEDKIAYSPKFPRKSSRHQGPRSHEIRVPANIYNRNVIVEDCSAEAIKQNIMKVDLNSSCPYSCSVCKFSTRTKKELYRHVRRRHMRDDQKPFSCSVCKMSFCHMAELRRHSRSHVTAKPFQCHICKNRYFKNKNHLKEHMYTHGTYLRFTCGYCDRKFAQNGPLYCHATCHDTQKPFKCMFCDAGFSSSTDLMRHMDKYSTESVKEKLQCTYCKEQFPNMNYLSKHILLHFPQDPFSCSVCSHTFTTFRKMYSHKTNLQHFTKQEREQAKKDVVAPGRRFKKTVGQKPLEETETTEAVSSLGEEVPVNQDGDGTSSGGSETALYEGSEIVEIEICEDMANTINTKEGLALFEDQVLRGMLEINPSTRQIVGQSKGGNIAELSTLVGQGHTIKAEVEEYEVESPDVSYIIDAAEASTSSSLADVNDGKAELIASILAHNEPGKAQIYQMPDGSLIHVIVQKDST